MRPPIAPMRAASETSTAVMRSNSPAGVAVISLKPGRKLKMSGIGSAQAKTTALPAARSASPNPRSEPTASPSGLMWVMTSARVAAATRAQAADRSSAFIVIRSRLRVGGRGGGFQFIEQMAYLLDLFGTGIPVKDDLRRAAQLHAAADFAADEAFRAFEDVHHLPLARLVADRRGEYAGMFQLAVYVHARDCHQREAWVLHLTQQQLGDFGLEAVGDALLTENGGHKANGR